ncbi:MAG: hypothetical protein KBT21_08710 [Treponema sp.]|nr:hypothetical protein [Candidatus Treponema merdequi]
MLKFGSSEVKKVLFNGNDCKTVKFNGNVVFNSETVKFKVTLRFDSTYVSGKSGGYDQCGETYGWVEVNYDNKVTASVTANKSISSWSIKFNGNLEAWIEGWQSASSHKTLLSSGSTLTSSSPASSVKRQYFYTRTDYQDSGQIYRLFYPGNCTITINFTDGTSVTHTYSFGWVKSDYDTYLYNKTLYADSGEIPV